MIDLHCHLLPGLDDGPATMDDTLVLARAMAAAGIERVVATPHVSGEYPNDPVRIGLLVQLVEKELARRAVPLRVEAGAEIDLTQLRALGDDAAPTLTLGDSRVLLIECPFTRVAPHFEARVQQLMGLGHTVLLAHPERSPLFLREHALLARLTESGAYASLTGASLTGRFGSTAREFSQWALDEGMAHNVATDAHNVRGRSPVLREGLAHAGYEWCADWLTRDVPEALLNDRALPARPSRPARMRPWGRKRTSGRAR
ncbi:tyrosine-protein phosphatase [Baekduia sp. Peel2402]|uniref:tyrosine-protein phosphatase n=1 Tax=Baekduia sp. Peel2402 TaxID=3458296 RepID=UPI00403EDB66